MKIKNFLSTLVIVSSLTLAANYADAGRQPCSGKKGGVARCAGTKFVCNDGSISKSKKKCMINRQKATLGELLLQNK